MLLASDQLPGSFRNSPRSPIYKYVQFAALTRFSRLIWVRCFFSGGFLGCHLPQSLQEYWNHSILREMDIEYICPCFSTLLGWPLILLSLELSHFSTESPTSTFHPGQTETVGPPIYFSDRLAHALFINLLLLYDSRAASSQTASTCA